MTEDKNFLRSMCTEILTSLEIDPDRPIRRYAYRRHFMSNSGSHEIYKQQIKNNKLKWLWAIY